MRYERRVAAILRVFAVIALLICGLGLLPTAVLVRADDDFHYSMLVVLHTCSQNVSTLTDPDQIRAVCTTPIGNQSVVVRFDGSDGSQTDLSGLTDPNGSYQAPEILQAGSYDLLTPSAPDGFSAFSATVLSVDDNSKFVGSPTVFNNLPDASRVITPTAPHEHFQVEFNYFDPNAAAPGGNQTPSLIVRALTCDSDISVLTDANAMIQACPNVATGVPIALDNESGFATTTTVNDSGDARFSVPGANYVMTAPIAAGFNSEFVICAEFTADDIRVTENLILRADELGRVRIGWQNPDDNLACFVLAFTGAGGLIVNAMSCTDNPYELTNFTDFCTTPIIGLTIVYSLNGNDPNPITASTDDTGKASIAVGIGGFNLAAPTPSDFNNAELICSETDSAGNTVVPASGFPLGYTGGKGSSKISQAGDTTTCWFLYYNSPDGMLNAPPPGISGSVLLCDSNFASIGPSTDAERAIKNDCPLVGGGINLSLTFPDGTTQQITSGPDGKYEFTNLPAGSYQLRADGPAGNTGLNAFCFEVSADNILENGFPDTSTSGATTISLDKENEVLRCRLLLYNPDGATPNIGSAKPTGSASFVFNVWSCDGNPWESSTEQWMAFCNGRVANQTIKVTNADGKFSTISSDNKGTVTIPANPGSYTLEVKPPLPFTDAVLSCTEADANGAPVGTENKFPMGLTGGKSGTTITQDGDITTCWILLSENLEGALNPPPPGISGKVMVCSSNLALTGASSDSARAMKNDCAMPDAPVTLTVTKPDGSTVQATTDADGNYSFAELPVGSYQLHGETPAPNTGILAFCHLTGTDSLVTDGWFPDSVTAGSITLPVDKEKEGFRCRVLLYDPNGPAPDTAVVTTSPANADTTTGNGDAQENTDDQPGNNGQNHGTDNDQTGGNSDQVTNGGNTKPADNSGGTQTGGGQQTSGGQTNQGTGAAGNSQIQIQVFVCPNGFSSTNTDQLAATCSKSDDPIRFTLSGAANATKATGTPNAGTVLFDGLKPGNWTIAEELPDGFAGANVFCAIEGGDLKPVAVIRNNTARIRISDGQSQSCQWFNVTRQPSQNAGDAPTATLTLTLRTCPAGYNPDATSADPARDCTTLTDNVNISATGADGLRERRQTGETDPGVAVYDGLVAGSYRLHQGYPPGVDHGFILACTSDARELTPIFTPFARIDKTGSIKITLEAPENMRCDWYNIPPKPDSAATPTASPQVTTSGAPGTGAGVRVSVTVLTCEGIASPGACESIGSGFGVSFSPNDGEGGPLEAETDAKGVSTTKLVPGTYAIDSDKSACFADSDAINASGDLVVESDPVTLTLFICQ